MEKTAKERILEHIEYMEKKETQHSFKQSQALIALAIVYKEIVDAYCSLVNSKKARFEGSNIKTNSCLKLKYKVLDYCWFIELTFPVRVQ
ncbi:hypothetical protein D3C73_1259770 [compost metagenome]|uniref:hypothetical protein n=1 Tax=Paenibacillus graminis TaxID=189425 RepID=UPI000FB52632|nr:hypothetical protein [Paenibacillus graminis]MEC0171938.1 hypothetical protein [Paenibacillus graminis]